MTVQVTESNKNSNKNNVSFITTAIYYIQKIVYAAFSTCSDFDSLWCEPPVDVIDKHIPLLFCQIQPIQDGGITDKQMRQQKCTLDD